MALPQTFNFEENLKGDRFPGATFAFQSPATVAMDLTGVTARVEFRKGSKTGMLQKAITIGSGITVATPSNGVLVIDPFVVDFPASMYYYDIELTFPDGRIKTYVGGTFQVIQDVTQTV